MADSTPAPQRPSFAHHAREDMVDRATAASLLCISPATLAGWAVKGGGPKMTRLGRAVRYQVSDLLAFIESQKRASTTA